MPRRYSFDSDLDETEPLDLSPRRQQHGQQHQHAQQHRFEFEPTQDAYYDLPPTQPPQPQSRPQDNVLPQSAPRPPRGPAFHPESSYGRLANDRRRSSTHDRAAVYAAAQDEPAPTARAAAAFVSAETDRPPPPPHRNYGADHQPQYLQPPTYVMEPMSPQTNTTPGADDFSEAAAGGLPGLAYGVAERNPRASGMEAMHGLQQQQQQPYVSAADIPSYAQHTYPEDVYPPRQHPHQPYQAVPYEVDDPALVSPPRRQSNTAAYAGGGILSDRDSGSSMQGFGRAGYPPGIATPHTRTPSRSPNRLAAATDVYTDDPYQRHLMPAHDAQLGYVDPNEIEDDGDDGLEYGRTRRGARVSVLSLGGYSSRNASGAAVGSSSATAAAAAAVVGASAAASGAAAVLGAHNVARDRGGNPDAFGLDGGHLAAGSRRGSYTSANGAYYNALGGGRSAGAGAGAAAGNTGYEGYSNDGGGGGGGGRGYPSKSEWLAQETRVSKRYKWAILIGIALVAIAAIVCGVVFGIVLKNKNNSSSSKDSSNPKSSGGGGTSSSGDLDIDSPEIKKLLNNKNLHKVFPGVDYTPLNTQYPDCLANPPLQNNITQDVAILSQLTNTIRLYGTDCNQTEMTIHAIKQLKMQDTVKIWMGVWQDKNATTNARQLAQMWDILDKQGADPFKGLIVANEILFREQMTVAELGTLLEAVRTNLTKRNLDLPVATSDLGDMWTAGLAAASDYVMANIHPFFGGINAKSAASWTWSFWENNNGPIFKTDASKNIISETGWPSQGGMDCGTGATETDCPDAAVAGISQMNQFMADWVCDALANGTQYFWFEAFDEPWKIQYDTGAQNWEDHWGLLDIDRNLKPGVEIPDCGGKTV